MTEEAVEAPLERVTMLWPPALKEAVRVKAGARELTSFTIGAVEARLATEDRMRELEKEVGELRYLSQLLADRYAMGGDHEERNSMLMEVGLPSWMSAEGWPADMKTLVRPTAPTVTKIIQPTKEPRRYTEEELRQPMTVVGAQAAVMEAALEPAFIHVADRKAGDETALCRHEYAGHDGPCEPATDTEPFSGATEPEEMVVLTEEAKETFGQAGTDLFSRIQTKAAEKGVDISGAGLVPASKLPIPERAEEVHNHSFERRPDGNLYCSDRSCEVWVDESVKPPILHGEGWVDELPTEPVPVLEVQTPVSTAVATRVLDDIEVDF